MTQQLLWWLRISLCIISHFLIVVVIIIDAAGAIPAFISCLSSLTYLALSTNRLTGEFLYLHKYEYISLYISFICIYNCCYYCDNDAGSIPLSIGSLSALAELYLHYNKLTGDIPYRKLCPRMGNAKCWDEFSHENTRKHFIIMLDEANWSFEAKVCARASPSAREYTHNDCEI